MKGFSKSLRRWLWRVVQRSRLAEFLKDELFVKIQYEVLTGDRLDLWAPKDFNQKLQWLKLYYRNPLLVVCADKYAVREFVKERIGGRYLNDVIGIYSRVEEIPFESFPKEFVLKATHGSGWNIICSDKSKIDWERACAKMAKWLRSDFSKNGREWQYREIPPKIICEKFLHASDIGLLRDYKIFAFDGECKYIWVDFDETQSESPKNVRSTDGALSRKSSILPTTQKFRNIYDVNWVFQPGKRILKPNQETPGVLCPECLHEMLSVASELSRGFPQCRVDLYVIDNKRIVFGEMTFSSANGCGDFIPKSFGRELGSYVTLPENY